jgi:hypothetical protein
MQFDQLKRREFITLGSGVLALPLMARAHAAGKLPVIGFLISASPSLRFAAFVQGLREAGYVENQNLMIEYRYAHSNDFCNRLRPLSPSTALVGGMFVFSTDPPRAATTRTYRHSPFVPRPDRAIWIRQLLVPR